MIRGPLAITGFGDTPLARTPIAASVLNEMRLRDAGARSLSDLTRLDAGVSAAYDADGYLPTLSVRGFTVDNRYNQRRDGLPINGETLIGLANKRSLEVLKGTSGMQAGTSAPGGLVNYTVKRPTARVRSASLELREHGDVVVGTDLSERFGDSQAFGVRVNAEHQRLAPAVRDAQGTRWLGALAADWRPTPATRLEVEAERSHQSQPSVPGFSLLGNTLPSARSVDPRINLNNQAWTLPVVLNGTTASLRATHTLGNDWRLQAHAMQQQLVNQDRVAFPYGVYDPATFECAPCDRYASDGTFTLWEFQSDNERRRTRALDLNAEGSLTTGPLKHRVAVGVLGTQHRARFGQQVFDIAGTGNVAGTLATPRSAGTVDENTDRNERSTELYVRDALEITPQFSAWLGLRHVRLDRRAVRTDGSRPTAYVQSFTTPWLALSYRLTPQTMAYASAGQGIESDVAPNRSRYTNAGQPLPALRSRQTELGVKHDGQQLDASMAVFDITRPAASDLGACDGTAGSCTRAIDGSARHRGAEALVSWHDGQNLTLHGSVMVLDAKRRGAADAATNGLRPVNVPKHALRAQVAYALHALASGLSATVGVVHEGPRAALPDNTASIRAWTRLDVGAKLVQNNALGAQGTTLTWRVGVDNATNARAWKEAPYQFGHAYLFPLAPRTVRMSLQAAF
jgi:iron complex outermembrane recepter protein